MALPVRSFGLPRENALGDAALDDPAVLCANVRSLARWSHDLLSRTGPGSLPPTQDEINELLRRLIHLRHQVDRFRLYHGLRTVELERWAGNLLRKVLTACVFRSNEMS